MNAEQITDTLQMFIDNHEIAGANLLIRKNGELIYKQCLGYADIENKTLLNMQHIFRLASMSKPVTGIAIMQLIEQGKMGLFDQVSKYIPEFRQMKVCENFIGMDMYEPDPDHPGGSQGTVDIIKDMTYIPARREITIFDLLTHSSGLGHGPVSTLMSMPYQGIKETCLERARKYSNLPLDFQPGSRADYSAVIGMEVLGGVLEAITGERFEDYIRKNITQPLGAESVQFYLNEKQFGRVVKLYEYADGKLSDVAGTEQDWKAVNADSSGFASASAGLYGSVEDYEKIAHMFLNKGTLKGVQILKRETVEMMSGIGIPHTSIMAPGAYWGLSMAVFEKPELMGLVVESDSFGWSGAYGTHFYIDFQNNMEVVLGVNRSNIGGAASYVSRAVEKVITETVIRGQ